MSPPVGEERSSLSAWLHRRIPGVAGMKAAPQRKSPRAEKKAASSTLTIFDWDDTLLCTSHLLRGDVDSAIGVAPSGLRRLEDVAYRMLRHAMRAGHVYIVTNACSGWVEESASKHLPRLMPLLRDVSVISASRNFGEHFPGEVDKWKKLTFMQIARDVDMDSFKNLIVIGDSEFEMRAADTIGSAFENVKIKAVKLRAQPSEEDLAKQLQLVLGSFDAVVADDRDLTVVLEPPRHPVRRPQQQQRVQDPQQQQQVLVSL